MALNVVVTPEDVDLTITAFTRLDQRGDKKAMNKLAGRLQREQPHLLQFAAASRTEHGDKVGEAAVFYATLVWAMFDRTYDGTLPRLTAQNLATADQLVRKALSAFENLETLAVQNRVAPEVEGAQPNIVAKLRELVEEDVREDAMTADTAAVIYTPTQAVIEAFDAALSGRRAGEQQGTIVVQQPQPGRNEPCPCGSSKKYKKCHGAAA